MRPRTLVRLLVILCAVGLAFPGVPALLSGAPAHGTVLEREPVEGVDGGVAQHVDRHVAGDMVVDWVGGAPEGGSDALTSSGAPADLAVPSLDGTTADTHEHTEEHAAASLEGSGDVTEHHAAADGGYALFSTSARWLPGGYTIRLAGADARIEQYRSALAEAARVASALTGVPVRVAPGVGGSGDPAQGEIVAVLGSGPCGSTAVGCGGPGLTSSDLLWGRVWVHPSALSLSSAERANLAAHELGHALGLQHFDGSWSDGQQVMYPRITGAPTYRTGDGAGLRRMAGADDRPAGVVTSRTYAAGRAQVVGTLASGSRVRIHAGQVSSDVTASGGRFSGSLPLRAGTYQVCATSLDAGHGFRRDLGCAEVVAQGQPVAHLDGVRGSFQTIQLSGWAIDPQTAAPVDVEIRRNGVLVATVPADGDRADLGDRSEQYGTAHGFHVDVPALAGRNRVCVRVVGVGGGGHLEAGCAEIDHPVDPIGVLDDVRSEGLVVSVAGWALDPNDPEPVTIAVSIDGKTPAAGGTAKASQDRPDVARSHAAHGADLGFDHRVVVGAGRHDVCVTVLNVGLGRDTSLGCVEVVVQDPTAAAVETAIGAVGGVVGDVLGSVASPTRVLLDLQARATVAP